LPPDINILHVPVLVSGHAFEIKIPQQACNG
jgi:hypothetical protein